MKAGASEDLLVWCEEQLASWPAETRRAPWSWLAALDSGYTKPVWSLVRALELCSGRDGVVDVELPDPRVRPEVRDVTHLDLGGSFAGLAERADLWENLRSVHLCLTGLQEEEFARFAASEVVTRLETLVLVTGIEQRWWCEPAQFRVGRPLRARHVALRADDLTHLMCNDLVPHLRSAFALVGSPDEAAELASCPQLATLETLDIRFSCAKDGKSPLWKPYFGNVIDADDEACEAFFGRADLSGLRGLTVRAHSMGMGRQGPGGRGVAAVVGSGVLSQLADLTLQALPIADDAIAHVLGALDHARIERLTLSDLVATDRTAEVFGALPALPRLRHLDLSYNRLSGEGVPRLFDAHMPALAHLDLCGSWGGSPHYSRGDVQPIGDAGAEAVARSCAGLKELDLSATGLTPAGMRVVLELPLETLVVSGNPLNGMLSVPDAAAWRTLRTLTLDDCSLGAADIAAFPREAPQLQRVSLQYNNIDSAAAHALADWPVLPQLWELDLHDHIMGDDGLVALATSRKARLLLELSLEQDIWTARRRRYSAPIPAEVVAAESFPNLDAMFLGVVDGYHGSRRSCGFPDASREELIRTGHEVLVAYLAHVEPYRLLPDENPDPDPRTEDFRSSRAGKYAEDLATAQEFTVRVLAGDHEWGPQR